MTDSTPLISARMSPPILKAAIAELDKHHCRVAKKFCQQMRYLLRNSSDRFEPSSFHTMQYEFYAILRKHRSIVEEHQNPDIIALFKDELRKDIEAIEAIHGFFQQMKQYDMFFNDPAYEYLRKGFLLESQNSKVVGCL